MIRRSFRIGLWLGLFAGLAFALSKIFRPKPEAATTPTTWPPLEPVVPRPTPVPVPLRDPEVVAPVVTEPVSPVVAEPVAKKAPAPAKKAATPATKAAAPKKKLPPWVDPKGTICPKTHPVKGKLSSMIFQVPGQFAYERTTPDRCYKSADAAEDDGFRPAKR